LSPAYIYFDLDDTLLDHKQAEQAALTDLYGHFDLFSGIEPGQLIDTYHRINKELWEQYGNNHLDRETLQRLRFEHTLAELDLDTGRYNEVGKFYMDSYEDHWQWKEGAFRAFEKISRKFECGILTNGFSEVQKKKIKRFRLNRYTGNLVISEDVGFLKPQPEIFHYATLITGENPGDILYIGDSYRSDIEGGKSFGWNTAWYMNSSKREDTGKADFVFEDFEELCGYLDV